MLTGGAGHNATTKGLTSLQLISITHGHERGESKKNPPACRSLERLWMWLFESSSGEELSNGGEMVAYARRVSKGSDEVSRREHRNRYILGNFQ